MEQPFFITDLVSKLVKQCEYMIDTVFPVEEEERVKEGRESERRKRSNNGCGRRDFQEHNCSSDDHARN